jgi:hypothetical protein
MRNNFAGRLHLKDALRMRLAFFKPSWHVFTSPWNDMAIFLCYTTLKTWKHYIWLTVDTVQTAWVLSDSNYHSCALHCIAIVHVYGCVCDVGIVTTCDP